MAHSTLNRVLDDLKSLDEEELHIVEMAIQSHLSPPPEDDASPQPGDVNAWEVLDELMGSVSAPADWSEQHDHYLFGAPKHT
jgi:hypothetical protein